MGKVIMSGIVPQLSVPVSFKENFADNTWEQIIAACQTNAVPDTWEVGDQKAMAINGTDYLIDIIGKNHDDYADGSGKAPLTFQMHDLYNTTYQISASSLKANTWAETDMRNTHLPMIMSLMPIEVQNAIAEVSKYSRYLTEQTTSDKLFLLSHFEVTGQIYGNQTAQEGNQYEYYVAGNSMIKYLNGNSNYWWSRTRLNTANQSYFITLPAHAYTEAYGSKGVSFAFCF